MYLPKSARKKSGKYKYRNGQKTIMYARSGYHWVEGQYVPKGPEATGITMVHTGLNRHQRRYLASTAGQRALAAEQE